jgi:hypothetical protein
LDVDRDATLLGGWEDVHVEAVEEHGREIVDVYLQAMRKGDCSSRRRWC